MDTVRNSHSVLFKSLKVMKDKENLRNSHGLEETKVT